MPSHPPLSPFEPECPGGGGWVGGVLGVLGMFWRVLEDFLKEFLKNLGCIGEGCEVTMRGVGGVV